MHHSRRFALVALLAGWPAHRLAAQCPDGAPPPCRATPSLGARIPALALNDRTWLVLPFDNATRAVDAELIRQASVSQLYGEMSRWGGVKVVSDDRVADLLQQLPEAQRDRPGLEAARAMARRVGAGRLVLGGYLAAGGRANITAKVYETGTGKELRVVREPMSGFSSPAALDSLGASFGRLARGILDLPAGSGGGGGAGAGLGTSNIDAYRAYVAGMDAMNRVAFDSATVRFDRAVKLDSGFALPHLQLGRLLSDDVARRAHLEAAVRLAASLPAASRLLVDALWAQARADWPRLCSAAGQIVGADSVDATGWALLSACHNDRALVIENGRPRFRGDLNRALRAAERAYALAPNALLSMNAMTNVLTASTLNPCVPPSASACTPENSYRVSILPAGDSLAVVVNLWADVRHAPPDLAPAAVEGRSARWRRLLGLVERRLAMNQASPLLRVLAASTALGSGDAAAAEAHFASLAFVSRDTMYLGGSSGAAFLQAGLQLRLDVALALERPAAFNAYADSLFARAPTGLPVLRSMFGRLSEVAADTSVANRQNTAWRVLLTGVLPPGLDTLEQQMSARLTGQARDDFLRLSTLAGFHMRRTGPALDTAARHPLRRYQAWFARGDLPRARAVLAEFDNDLLARHPNTPDDGGWLFDAESHLELGDTATAYQRMREFGRRWKTSIRDAAIMEDRFFHNATMRLFGRSWMLYGDLAMARRDPVEARRAYTMVVGLWERGEAPVQPMVARAKAALAQLGK